MSLSLPDIPREFGEGTRALQAVVIMCPSLAVADNCVTWCKEKFPETESKKVFLFASGLWLVVVVDLAPGGTDAKQTDNP